MGCIILLLTIPFITIPSIIYGITPYFLFPISLFLLLFIGKPSSIRVSLLSLKLTPVVLIVVLPIIFYFYTWEIFGWIFFAWMLIYYLSRWYTGVHQKELNIIKAWREFDSFAKQGVSTYIRHNPILIAIIIVLTILSILFGYLNGGLAGLGTGVFLAILIWWLTPYSKETIKEIKKEENHGK